LTAWVSVFTAGVPIGGNGWDTIGVLNPADTSMFAKPCPSGASKSERMLFDASPPTGAWFLFEMEDTEALCE
jgi:hypothetical protein